MLKNNLARLLNEKSIKATKLSKDTGIARSTISRIVNNQTDKIEYSTIDSLCLYLGVTPNEFFDFVPVDFKITVIATENFTLSGYRQFYDDDHFDIDGFKMGFDIYIDEIRRQTKYTYSLVGNVIEFSNDTQTAEFSVEFEVAEESDKFKVTIQEIGYYFEGLLLDNLKEQIRMQTYEKLHEISKISEYDHLAEYLINKMHFNFVSNDIAFLPF